VRRNFAEGGLRKWVSEKWVDIGAPKKDGKYQPCGRSKGSKRKYPKCVPLAKATQMTSSQKALNEKEQVLKLLTEERVSCARDEGHEEKIDFS
jgi:hypothetical protein